jgi:hypothetical protein
MRRIRRHLTFANVASAIALFVALGGGTAVALNGTNTVQSDDLGPGAQVKAPDIAANAVKGSNVVDNGLSGADINEGSLTGNARRLKYSAVGSYPPASAPIASIAKVGPFTIKGSCTKPSPVREWVSTHIYVNGPAALADSFWGETRNDTEDGGVHSDGRLIPADTDAQVLGLSVMNGFERMGGTTILTTDSTTVQVNFNAVADTRPGSPDCFLYGTATRATT